MLCNNCNAGIGYLNDDVEILMNAIRYLNKHNKLANPKIINDENRKRNTITFYVEKINIVN